MGHLKKNEVDMYVYSIPFEDKFLIYSPLKQLAFVANSALVNLISEVLARGAAPDDCRDAAKIPDFVHETGVLLPDPDPPSSLFSEDSYNPTTAVLFLTSACNLRCVYCYASGGEKEVRELSSALGRAAIDFAAQNSRELEEDFFSVNFHGGGEPSLAWDRLRELVEYARGLDTPAEISLAGNGCWTREKRAWLLDNLDQISLSCDGLEKVQNRQRPMASGRGSFDLVQETIRDMDRRGFDYGIRLTVCDDSIDDLAPGIDFLCRESGCKVFQVEPAFNHGRAARDGLALHRNERFASAFSAAYDIAAAQGRHLYYSGARPWLTTRDFCLAPQKAVVVTPDGRLSACYEICDQDHPLSDVFFLGKISGETGPVIDHEVRDEFMTKIAERRELCRDCFCFWHCAGDCPSKTLTSEKDGHLNFGPRCDLNRQITKELLIRFVHDAGGLWRG